MSAYPESLDDEQLEFNFEKKAAKSKVKSHRKSAVKKRAKTTGKKVRAKMVRKKGHKKLGRPKGSKNKVRKGKKK